MPEVGPDALVAAVLHQQPLQKLLRAGADPSVRDQAGLTPLHHAVLAGNVDAVEALLDYASKRTRPLRKPGGEPSRAPGSPWDLATAPGPPPCRPSPLHLAAERNDSLLRLILGHSSLTSVAVSFLGIIISSRPQPELLHLRDARGWSLLHYAVSRANLATMRQLLPHMGASSAELASGNSSRSSSAGGAAPPVTPHVPVRASCGVNAPDALGRTALHQAAHLGHADCCRLLLKAGADQSLVSAAPEGALPLHLAASGNHTPVIEVLFRHAVQQAGFRAAQTVLLRANVAGLTALHVAVQHGAVDSARRLLHLVFPFDTRGPLGRTALHLAALLGDTAMISMLLGHSTPHQRQIRDAEGFTAMHLAAATGRLEAMRVLVAGGCGVDSRAEAAPHAPVGCEGWTPLHCAVRRGDVTAIEMLVSELGADPHAMDACGRTPYDLAVAVAGDDSRQGSSVVGAGSGIQNLDDTQWATDATGTESEEGGGGRRSGGSPDGGGSRTTRDGGSGAVTAMVVDPLQGPSGVSGGFHGLNGGGSGIMRLDEAQALAVLQTFIRLLHDPVRRNNGLPPGGACALGASGTPTAQHQSAAIPPPRALPAIGTCESGGGGGSGGGGTTESAPNRMATIGCEEEEEEEAVAAAAAPSGVVGPPKAPEHAGPLSAIKHTAASDSGIGLGAGGVQAAAASSSSGPADSVVVPEGVAARPGPSADGAGEVVIMPNAKCERGIASGGVAAAAKENGVGLGHQASGLSPLVPTSYGQEPGGVNGPTVPSVALAYAAHLLAGPAATRTRTSPFSNNPSTHHRLSPFHTPSALAAAAAAAAGAAAVVNAANAAGQSGVVAAVATRSTATVGDGDGCTAAGCAAAAAGGAAAGGRAVPAAAAVLRVDAAAEDATNTSDAGVITDMSVEGQACQTAAGLSIASVAAPVTATIRRSPFIVTTKPSPFAAAAAVRPMLPPASCQPLPQAAATADSDVSKPATGAHGPFSGDEFAAAAATAAAATGAEATPPATVPAVCGGGSATPFVTVAALHQHCLQDSLLPGPPSDPAASLCIVSAINSPCGFSALNRAILLQRHALAEALLATLPPQGHNGGVLVLAPGGGGGRGAAAAVAYQLNSTANMGVVGAAVSSAQSKNPSPSPSRQMPPAPASSSSEVIDGGGSCGGGAAGPRPPPSRAATARTGTIPSVTAAPAVPLGPASHLNLTHTPPRHQPSHRQLLLLQQLNGGHSSSPPSDSASAAAAAATDSSSRTAPPLLPLRCPGAAAAAPAATPVGSPLIPGLVQWDEAHTAFRTQTPNHTNRAWLYWPGEPDPSTGWLVAELVVVEAGAAGGHVWLGLGPRPEVVAAPAVAAAAAASSSSHSSGSGLAAGPSATVSGLSTSSTAAPVPAGAPSSRAPAGVAGAAGAPGLIPVPMCAVINHPFTHVACIRDGQAFRGGVLVAGLGTATRLEARSGDTVALFWNRRGRSVAFTLNGRYCGRLSDLPANVPLTPLVGLQCGSFVFKWRCCSRVASGVNGGDSGGPPEPYTCRTCTSNIDGMLIREQMLHEDPETPWLCKPSMTSLHFAAWSGNVRVLQQLVRLKGFSPDEVDVDGWAPLHFAALAGQAEVVRLLLDLTCLPDRKSKYGSTPAMLAAKYGRSPEHVAIVRVLSDVGAVLDVRDPRGRTLLMLAARAGNLAMVQLLLERGLDPSATDALDREAQQYAGQHAAIFRLLRSAQAAQRAGSRKSKQRQENQQQQQQQRPAASITSAIVAAAKLQEEADIAQVQAQKEEGKGKGEADEAGDDTCEDEDSDGTATDAEGCFGGRGRDVDIQHLPLLAERWRISAEQLARGRLIEQGAFGAVFEGTWCGARVAIKQVMRRRRPSPRSGGGRGDGDEEAAEEEENPEAVREAASLEREVAILAALPPHERIARMLGSVRLPGEGICLVMAYYPHTLQAVMQSERLRRSWLTPARRATISRQLAEGLAFLHGLPGPRVIHRDLKPNNVLLEAAPSLGVKICDFGLSRILAGNDVQSSSAAGHAFWMAPELLRAQPYDEKADVYSYGVILYQLAYWVDDQLYGGLNKAQVDFQVVHGILRLQDRLPSGIDPAVQALVRDCVDEDPRNRPSMSQVLERLASVRELSQPGHGGTGSVHGGSAAAVTATAGGHGDGLARPAAGAATVAVAGGDPEHHRQV